jgi:hypothetical protein
MTSPPVVAPIPDSDCIAILEAEREVRTVQILAAHAGLSDRAIDRIEEALEVILAALAVQRAACRMNPQPTKEAA